MCDYWTRTHEHTYTISEPEDSEEQFSFRGDYGLDVAIISIHRSEVTGWNAERHDNSPYNAIYGYDDVPVGQQAYVVLVNYTTGDTFGSHGTWTIPAIKRSLEDAEEVVKWCNDPDHRPDERGYRPWDGYFEHINSVEIAALTVQP